ncbi:MAG: bifunctional oligoribonuclease/PAP phosphatase NrnA, partial [Phycisphaerae bacterium]
MPIPARQFDQAAKLLGPARRVLLTTHIRPDGDAIGCVVAMRQILRASGKDVLAVLLDPVPQHYELLSQPEPLLVWSRQVGPRDLGQLDAIVVLDTCSYSQLEPIADLLRSTSATKIVVDHHLTRDDLADCYLIDPQAAAASVLVWQWARQAGWPIDPVAARALF